MEINSKERKGRRRYITRAGAVDLPNYEGSDDAAPSQGEAQKLDTALKSPPQTPPSRRHPPQTPPSARTRRRYEHSPGSVSPSTSASPRRRPSPLNSPCTPARRANTLGTPGSASEMYKYGYSARPDTTPSSGGSPMGRSLTEGAAPYKYYPSYLGTRLAELDPTRATNVRGNSRRNSSSSESSVHGSTASLLSDGPFCDPASAVLQTPPSSPCSKQFPRSMKARPRSWCDPQQIHLQGQNHMSSESPTGFPFAASSYENLDTEGSIERVLPRSNTTGSVSTGSKKEDMSRIQHAKSFAGHEGRESQSPKVSPASSQFSVSKHFSSSKARTWQPAPKTDFGKARGRSTSDSSARTKFLPDSPLSPRHKSGDFPYGRDSTLTRTGSAGDSDASITSATSLPAFSGARTLGGESQEVALVTRRPVRDKVSRDRSFDSTISEPATLKPSMSLEETGYTQHAPRKAKTFAVRAQTIELSQLHGRGLTTSARPRHVSSIPENKLWHRPVSTVVREQAKLFDHNTEEFPGKSAKSGVASHLPHSVQGAKSETDNRGTPGYSVGQYKSATMPARLSDPHDANRRPSLPNQGDNETLLKDQFRKELVPAPPKRSQSFDTMGKKGPLFQAPGAKDEKSTEKSTGRAKSVMQSGSLIVKPVTTVTTSALVQSVLGVHKPTPVSMSSPSVAQSSTTPASSFRDKQTSVDSSGKLSAKSEPRQSAIVSVPNPTHSKVSGSKQTDSKTAAQVSMGESPRKARSIVTKSTAISTPVYSQPSKAISASNITSVVTTAMSQKPVMSTTVKDTISVDTKTNISGAFKPYTKEGPGTSRTSTALSVPSPVSPISPGSSSSVSKTRSPLLLPGKSSQSSLGSSPTSPRLSPRLSPRSSHKSSEQSSPRLARAKRDPGRFESEDADSKPQMKRGISKESIQSAMAVLDDAIAMLNSVAKETTTGSPGVTAVPVTTVTVAMDQGIDLSKSGLVKYSSQATKAKPMITSRYASMPLTTAPQSVFSHLPTFGSLSEMVAPPRSPVPQPVRDVTQVVSTVNTMVSSIKSTPHIKEDAVVPLQYTSLPKHSPQQATPRPNTGNGPTDKGGLKVSEKQRTDWSSESKTCHVMQPPDMSALDQILATMEEQCEPITSIMNLQSTAKVGIHDKINNKSSSKSKRHDANTKPEAPKVQKREKVPIDPDKPLEELENRRRTLVREDSFNRPDSDGELELERGGSPIALPRDSVILRHRYHIKEDSSSSESSSPATPRLSPRVMRRHKKASSDSSTIGDSSKRKHLAVPGRHHKLEKPVKDVNVGERLNRPPAGASLSPVPDHSAPYPAPRDVSPSTATYYSLASSGSPPVAPSSELTWSTPPSTPQMPRTAMGGPPPGQGHSSSASEVNRSRSGSRTQFMPVEEGSYNIHTGTVGRPGSAGLPSDSSSIGSRRERRRFRVREPDPIQENQVTSASSIRQQGRKDKSSQRKSTLNLPGAEGQDPRGRDSELSTSSSDPQNRSNAASPLGPDHHDNTAPQGHSGSKGQSGLFHIGKSSKKGAHSGSALGALISQTAILAPAVAQTAGASDPRAARTGLTIATGKQSDTQDSAPSPKIMEPQTPPPMDPITEVKVVTPLSSPRHEGTGATSPAPQKPAEVPRESDPRLVSTLPTSHGPHHPMRRQPSQELSPGRSQVSPPPAQPHPMSGKVSPPPGVPLMGSQMLSKLPSLGGHHWDISNSPHVLKTSAAKSQAKPMSAASTAASAQTKVVTVATGHTPMVVTKATTTTSPISSAAPKETTPKPIASPKVVKATTLKPLSETMKDLGHVPSHKSADQSKPTAKLAGTTGSSPHPVPMIAQQQHQGVETVRLPVKQQGVLQAPAAPPQQAASTKQAGAQKAVTLPQSLIAGQGTGSGVTAITGQVKAQPVTSAGPPTLPSHQVAAPVITQQQQQVPGSQKSTSVLKSQTTKETVTASQPSIEVPSKCSESTIKEITSTPTPSGTTTLPKQRDSTTTTQQETQRQLPQQQVSKQSPQQQQLPKLSPQQQQLSKPSPQQQQLPKPSPQQKQLPKPSPQQQQLSKPSQQQQLSKPSPQQQQLQKPSPQQQQLPKPSPQQQQLPKPSSQQQQLSKQSPQQQEVQKPSPQPQQQQVLRQLSQEQHTEPSQLQKQYSQEKPQLSLQKQPAQQLQKQLSQEHQSAGQPASSSQSGGKKIIYKLKATVTEVEPHPIAKVASPPLTKESRQDSLLESAPEAESEAGAEADIESAPEIPPQKSIKDKPESGSAARSEGQATAQGHTDMQAGTQEPREETITAETVTPVKSPQRGPPQRQDKVDLGPPQVVPFSGTSPLKRSASAPIQKRGVVRPQVSRPDVTETKLQVMEARTGVLSGAGQNDEMPKTGDVSIMETSKDSSCPSERELEFETPPSTPTSPASSYSSLGQFSAVAAPDHVEISVMAAVPPPTTAGSTEEQPQLKEDPPRTSEVSEASSEEDEESRSGTQTDEDTYQTEEDESKKDEDSSSQDDKFEDPVGTIETATVLSKESKLDDSAVNEGENIMGEAIIEEEPEDEKPEDDVEATDTADRGSEGGQVSGEDTEEGKEEEEEEEGEEEGDKFVVASGSAVSDKVAGWQQHFLVQQMAQTQRQALLRERRGPGIWSSGDSIPDPVSVLSPITEDRSEARPETEEESGGEGERRAQISVAHRILLMENKVDEEKFTLTRPTSGFTTPRLKVLRPIGSPLKGAFTPHHKHLEPTSPLATDEHKLLAKLSHVADIAMVRDAGAERHKRFQQRRLDDRRRTQPITLEEIREADSLESVTSFRAEVLRKASFNVFEQGNDSCKQDVLSLQKKVKGHEVFPQHIKVERLKERRKDNSRYKTLPVTQLELNQIPESETLTLPERQATAVKTLRQRLEEMERDSTEDVRDGKSDTLAATSVPEVTPADNVSGETSSKTSVDQSVVDQSEGRDDAKTVVMATKQKVVQVSAKTDTQSSKQDVKQFTNQTTSTPAQIIKTVSTATVTTATMSTVTSAVSTSGKKSMSSKMAKLEVSDDELDKLVAINYKEISSKKKRQALEAQSGTSAPSKPSVENQSQGQEVKIESHRTVPTTPSLTAKIPSQSAVTAPSGSPGDNLKQQKKSSFESKAVTKPANQSSDKKNNNQVASSTNQVSGNKQTLSKATSESTIATAASSRVLPKQQSMPSATEVASQPTKAKSVSALNLLKEDAAAERRGSAPDLDQDVSTTDTETAEDELSKMSMSEKLQLFRKLDKTAAQESEQATKHKRRFSDRRKRMQRANTMPVTGEEISNVATPEISETPEPAERTEERPGEGVKQDVPFDKGKEDGPGQGVRRGSGSNQQREQLHTSPGSLTSADDKSTSPTVPDQKNQTENASDVPKEEKEEEEKDDPLSKLSLAEKVRLFSERREEESPQKREAAVLRRKNRRLQSRFKTQPITCEEVEKASRVSPLAMSLVKPPDPELLQTMSVKDQREFAAQWAEATLSDSGSRPGSRPSSVVLDDKGGATRRASTDEGSGDERKRKGILKSSDQQTPEVRSILKPAAQSSEREVRGILKSDQQPAGGTPIHSDSDSERKPTGILKREAASNIHEQDPDPEPKLLSSILKKDSPTHEDKLPESTAHSILKRDSVQYDTPGGDSTHGILKKDSPSYEARQEIRGILKKESSFEMTKTEPEKGVLKRRDSGGPDLKMEGAAQSELSNLKTRDLNSNEKAVNHDLEDEDAPEVSKQSQRSDHTTRKTSDSDPMSKVRGQTNDMLDRKVLPQNNNTLDEKSSVSDRLVDKKSLSEIPDDAHKTEVNVSGSQSDPRPRGRVKSDEDLPRTPKNNGMYPRPGSNIGRSRSARVAGRGGDSSTEEDSSTSSEKMSWIKNDAVARRRLRRMEEKTAHKRSDAPIPSYCTPKRSGNSGAKVGTAETKLGATPLRNRNTAARKAKNFIQSDNSWIMRDTEKNVPKAADTRSVMMLSNEKIDQSLSSKVSHALRGLGKENFSKKIQPSCNKTKDKNILPGVSTVCRLADVAKNINLGHCENETFPTSPCHSDKLLSASDYCMKLTPKKIECGTPSVRTTFSRSPDCKKVKFSIAEVKDDKVSSEAVMKPSEILKWQSSLKNEEFEPSVPNRLDCSHNKPKKSILKSPGHPRTSGSPMKRKLGMIPIVDNDLCDVITVTKEDNMCMATAETMIEPAKKRHKENPLESSKPIPQILLESADVLDTSMDATEYDDSKADVKVHKSNVKAKEVRFDVTGVGNNTSRHSMSAELESKINGRHAEELNDLAPGGTPNSHRPLEKSRSSPEKTPNKVSADPTVVKLRENKSTAPRPNSIAERLSMLQDSQAGWKNKVEEKDMSKFTIEGKLNRAGITPQPESPFSGRRQTSGRFTLKRESPETSPKLVNGEEPIFKRTSSLRLPVTPKLTDKDPRSWLRKPQSPKSSPNLSLKLSSSSDITSETESDSQTPSWVRVPQPDEEGFSEFFSQKSLAELSVEKVKVTIDDFDHVFIESNDILQSTRKIKAHRKKAGSRNPLKNLADRLDLQLEYEEVRTDVADRELRRIKREQIAGTAHLAQEALAGLASKENFSKVSLRKTDSFTASTPNTGHQPYKELMLLQVKGRRHCQTRLVEPVAKSINSGDCFLLVTTDRLYVWQGDYSNVIERSRAAELASIIHQKRDLGCKLTSDPVTITEAKQDVTPAGKRFWDALGGLKEYQSPGPAEEDELYEMYMAEATKIYGIKDDQLVLLDSGYLPTYEDLNSQQALVFDFGSEMYVWTGKHVPFVDRKQAIKLAKAEWQKGYDFSDLNINPLTPLCVETNGGLPMKADQRPNWALFGKVNENMETVLFKEKFLDWPDTGRVIKVKSQDEEDKKNDPAAELTPYDVSKMLPIDTSPVTMTIEGSHVGRGQRWTEVYEGLRREYEVLTLGVEVFHILEYDHIKLDPESHGQFHDGDTYVIRWNLMISQTGMRHIRTQEARHSLTGRERWAYFFWQGRHSTITEKGASALMTVELDEERGPQIRVTQGREPPCFLQLFQGHMIIHSGKREDETTNTQGSWRMYLVRNELHGESYLQEVPCRSDSLRSRSSCLLLNVKTGILHVWHGAKSASHTRQRAAETAKWLSRSCPQEVGLHDKASIIVNDVSEGSERSDFWVAMDTRVRTYNCMIKDTAPQRHSPRLFYMQSVCGEFVAKEILNPSRNHDNVCAPFGFDQRDLYDASQPGLFLIDNHHEVYLWQGWWPEETETIENVRTGSAEARFNVDRRLAVETTLNYCKEKNSASPPKAWLVFAGLEPPQVTNLFPVWKQHEEATRSNRKEGKKQDERVPLVQLLQRLTCTLYTFAQLQERPLPEGVDPLKLETYLNDDEFEKILKMKREEFAAIPSWKQNNLKKDSGLF